MTINISWGTLILFWQNDEDVSCVKIFSHLRKQPARPERGETKLRPPTFHQKLQQLSINVASKCGIRHNSSSSRDFPLDRSPTHWRLRPVVRRLATAGKCRHGRRRPSRSRNTVTASNSGSLGSNVIFHFHLYSFNFQNFVFSYLHFMSTSFSSVDSAVWVSIIFQGHWNKQSWLFHSCDNLKAI